MEINRTFILLALLLIGCQEEVRQTVIAPANPNADGCAEPLIKDGDSCCLDRDRDGTCDTIESVQTEASQEGVRPGTSQEKTIAKERVEQEQKEITDKQEIEPPKTGLFGSLIPFQSNAGFLSPMKDEKTLIVFDSEKTTGTMVLSALHLKLFLDNPTNLVVLDHVSDLEDSEESQIQKSHLILLGNGCTNSMIAEIEGLIGEGCQGTEKGTGLIKFYTQAGKRVMLVIGYDDEDIYALEKKIVLEEIAFTGKEMEVAI